MVKKLLIQIRYSGPEKFAVETIDVPAIGDDDVLVQNTDNHQTEFSELTDGRSKSRLVVYAER